MIDEVRLYHGEQLSLEEARSAVGSRAMRLVSIVGDHRAGKTTLLAALFERLQTGPFAGLSFAGTRTPRGFDSRCHDSRVTSGRRHPRTRRTQFEQGLHFLHLSLLEDGPRLRHEVLFADRPGEQFEEIRRSSDNLPRLVELPAADVVLLLVDGDRMRQPSTRGVERHKATVTARTLHEGQALRPGTRLLVVMTKVDLVEADEVEKVHALRGFEALVELLRVRYGSTWAVEGARVAARAEDGSLPLCFGVERLLSAALAVPEADAPMLEARAEDPSTLSAFDLFGYRA